jgi:hypothetical protein
MDRDSLFGLQFDNPVNHEITDLVRVIDRDKSDKMNAVWIIGCNANLKGCVGVALSNRSLQPVNRVSGAFIGL